MRCFEVGSVSSINSTDAFKASSKALVKEFDICNFSGGVWPTRKGGLASFGNEDKALRYTPASSLRKRHCSKPGTR